MTILVIGGSGFLGKHLSKALIEQNYDVIVQTRNAEKTRAIFKKLNCSPTIIEKLDEISLPNNYLKSIICMSGAGIVDKHWTPDRKKALIESRIKPVLEAKDWLTKNNIAIEKLLVGSAIGFYGFSDNPDHEFNENSPHYEHFAHELCEQLENTSKKLDRVAENIVQLRTGVVLGKNGGALQKMVLPAKFHLNGSIGSGEQWVSWIHLQDWINAVTYILSSESPREQYNLTSPNSASNKEVSQAIGKALGKPFQLPVPKFPLKLLLGEAATLLTGSQKVIPANLQAANFDFLYPEINSACQNLLQT